MIVAVRLALSALLIYGVYREAGPWTATSAALTVAALEVVAARLRRPR